VSFFACTATALIGASVGGGELITRYRDKPSLLIFRPAAYGYAAINAVAAVAVLNLVDALGWHFGLGKSYSSTELSVIVSGTSAMALLRSSFANVRVGNTTVPIGLQAVLEVYLWALDRSIDRRRAKQRDKLIGEIMDGFDFQLATASLPGYCFQLLQNSGPDEEAAVGSSIRQLRDDEELPEEVKIRILGLQLLAVVGEDVLRQAVKGLKAILKSPTDESRVQAEKGLNAPPIVVALDRVLESPENPLSASP
jgi:hypothetical protein